MSTESEKRTSPLCDKRGGKPKVQKNIIMYLVLWLASGIVGYIVSYVGALSLALSFDLTSLFTFASIWGIISMLIWLLGVIFFILMIYYIVVYFTSCNQ